jgi:hypothetical protein
MGRPKNPHRPTGRSSAYVENMVAAGIKPEVIARVMDISVETLKKTYAAELEFGQATAVAKVVANVLDIATSNSRQAVSAAALFLKNRAGWTDKQSHEFTGADGKPIETATVTLDAKTVEAIRRRYITNGD